MSRLHSSAFPVMIALSALALPQLAAAAAAAEIRGVLDKDDLPDTGREWISLSENLEFQPAEDLILSGDATGRFLVDSSGSYSGYENQFVDGSGTYYNDYAQAWRLLGFYVDCNAPHNNFNECSENNGGGGGGNGGGEGDNDNEAACQRYLMWAAYVDLDYSGGGIGEYQFYDRQNHRWDATSCKSEKNGRCARMDCHLKDTHFKLLGFFKEPNYHEWMEQLFKHQGVCLWTNEEYYFMQTDRYLWPCYCTATGTQDEDGNTLYYDTKPMAEGRIGLGLYTDSRCKYDYEGELNILDVLKNAEGGDYGSVYDLQAGLEKWNDAFDVFKVCQPCKAYNLGYNKDLNTGQGDRQGGDEDEGYAFDCYDDADYLNVNQCMKFKTKTEMLAADFRDIILAHEQGNIVEVEVMGKTYGYGGYRTAELLTSFTMTGVPGISTGLVVFFCLSVVFMICSAIAFVRARRARAAASPSLNEPLMT